MWFTGAPSLVRRGLRTLTAAVLGGTVTGCLIGGVGARLAMRVIALADRSNYGEITEAGAIVGRVSLEGTIEVLATGAVIGVFGALLYVAIRRWLPHSKSQRVRSFAIVIVLLGLFIAFQSNRSDFDFLPWLPSFGLFGLVLLLYGLSVAALIERLLKPTVCAR